ncbi:condensation domain-containing protein [Bacillus pumilus]|uniref:condensation domain-containing protein n=1 Tax=Bacillus pumilus TaxID=1408 RepID=UPI0013748EE9|nr:condensation domain-containing protein [Bacillus pumilus]QHQ78073.1 hypothetical protein GPS65_19165 [Bacillus pumilus]
MTYNMPMVLSIEGALDIKRLEGALQTIVSRHESLRSSFHMVDDELVQKIDENLICQLQYFYADSNTDVEKAIQSFIRA